MDQLLMWAHEIDNRKYDIFHGNLNCRVCIRDEHVCFKNTCQHLNHLYYGTVLCCLNPVRFHFLK